MNERSHSPTEDASVLLERLIQTGRLPSTVLITAPPGAGKRKLAFECAAALLHDVTGGANRGENADLGVFDYGDKVFKVDYARELRMEAFKSPAVADMRVFVLMHVQNMTPEAQNALLKLLEEPPAHVCFFLLCENEGAMLQTILSRCLKLHLSPPDTRTAMNELRRRFPEATEDELTEALRLSSGYPEGAADYLEDMRTESGQKASILAEDIMDAALKDDEYALWKLIVRQEKPTKNDVALLLEILRQKLIFRIRKEPYPERLLKLDRLAIQMQELLQKNVNPLHVLELFPQYFA